MYITASGNNLGVTKVRWKRELIPRREASFHLAAKELIRQFAYPIVGFGFFPHRVARPDANPVSDVYLRSSRIYTVLDIVLPTEQIGVYSNPPNVPETNV